MSKENKEEVGGHQRGHEYCPALEVQHLKHRVHPEPSVVGNEAEPEEWSIRAHTDIDAEQKS